MAEDEIERLLREINATTGQPATPAPRPAAEVAPADKGTGRMAFAAVAGVGLGGVAFVVCLLTPFTDNFWTAVGVAGGSFVTALVAGPPRWFSS